MSFAFQLVSIFKTFDERLNESVRKDRILHEIFNGRRIDANNWRQLPLNHLYQTYGLRRDETDEKKLQAVEELEKFKVILSQGYDYQNVAGISMYVYLEEAHYLDILYRIQELLRDLDIDTTGDELLAWFDISDTLGESMLRKHALKENMLRILNENDLENWPDMRKTLFPDYYYNLTSYLKSYRIKFRMMT